MDTEQERRPAPRTMDTEPEQAAVRLRWLRISPRQRLGPQEWGAWTQPRTERSSRASTVHQSTLGRPLGCGPSGEHPPLEGEERKLEREVEERKFPALRLNQERWEEGMRVLLEG